MATKEQWENSKKRKELKIALCSACQKEKSWDEFEKDSTRRPFGLASSCRVCNIARKKKSFYKNWKLKTLEEKREIYRHRNLLKFGLTKIDWDNLFDSQNGVCAICKHEETDIHPSTKKRQNLAIDHNHKTGKVRGLLCGKCNKGLGSFMDSIEILNSAIEYLKSFQ